MFGHFHVGLVIEMKDSPAARLKSGRADEGRDRARLGGAHLVDDRIERQRFLGEKERTTRDGWDQRDLVAVAELPRRFCVLAVDGIEQAGGLFAEAERGPDVGDGARLDLAARPAGALAEPREKPDVDAHLP